MNDGCHTCKHRDKRLEDGVWQWVKIWNDNKHKDPRSLFFIVLGYRELLVRLGANICTVAVVVLLWLSFSKTAILLSPPEIHF